ncbi:MAG TPA: preprotein translocase subunit SecE [Actinomycetota bacterium]
MNRATKRLLAKQEAQAEKTRQRTVELKQATKARAVQEVKREGRLKRWRRFLKEVRQELRKVSWPTRTEVLTYTVVVLVSVTFVTTIVFALDFVFARGLLYFYGSG